MNIKQLFCQHEYEIRYVRHTDSTGIVYARNLSDFLRKIPYVDFHYWDERFEYCPKCYKEVHYPICEHDWQPAEDDGSAPLYCGIKPEKVAICKKCGTKKFHVIGRAKTTY